MDDILDNELTKGKYENFREFLSLEEAKDFGHWLDQNQVDYKIERPGYLIDQAIVGKAMIPEAVVKINTRDFKRVNELLTQEIEQQDIPEEHYLWDFSDRELFQLLQNSDKWNIEDLVIAKKILLQRGYKVPDNRVEDHQKAKYEELRSGKDANPVTIIFYLVTIVLGVIFLHPLLFIAGIGMGWYFWQDMTTDPYGEKFFTFALSTRKAGQLIFYGGIFLTIAAFFLLLFFDINYTYWIYN